MTGLLDASSLAERLGMTEAFVRRRVFNREIPFYKIGTAVRFDPAEIDAWLAERHHDAEGL